jgi:ornithine cyclodeaminase
MIATPSSVLILKAEDVSTLLENKENELVQIVRDAYQIYAIGDSSLPHSSFLRFPDSEVNRIIALPAYLGGDFGIAGIKWISSFPGNHEIGLDRASAVIMVNSRLTGRLEVIIEGSLISAKRTAASAALAAQHLTGRKKVRSIGLIGCGLINFETTRFLMALYPEIKSLTLFDIHAENAERFAESCQTSFPELRVSVSHDIPGVLESSPLISIATTAVTPHISDLSACAPGATILHISLRDLTPEVILSADNVVDDMDHVCRASTSIHLAEQLVGHRDFMRCTLAEVINGAAPARETEGGVTIFSPFGLGILDMAVSKHVCDLASRRNIGTLVKSFLPGQSR